MEYIIVIASSLGGIFFTTFSFLLLGYWLRKKQKISNDQKELDTKIVDGAILTLMGLLVAFTFSGANARLDNRRNLIIQEAKSIMNTYYYFDILPPEIRDKACQDLNVYITSRLKWSQIYLDKKALDIERQKIKELQKKLWSTAFEVCRTPGQQRVCRDLPKVLMEMFMQEEESSLYKHLHPPRIIYVMLICIVLMGALLAGYNIKGELRDVGKHMFAFATIMSLMLFVILNLEFPRAGIFSNMIFENFDTALTDIQKNFCRPVEK